MPSRVLLDEPYPENLPVVPACNGCNAGFSPHEEYVACLIDCILAGSSRHDSIGREKIARILRERPSLSQMLRNARHLDGGVVSWDIENERVRKFVLKLARGHVAFELNDPRLEEPSSVGWTPLILMSADEREKFETPLTSVLFPEVGSRAMNRMCVVAVKLVSVVSGEERVVEFLADADWIEVQANRYRYLVCAPDAGGAVVRIVLSEYLACQVIWRDCVAAESPAAE